jgi:hypothetical protein
MPSEGTENHLATLLTSINLKEQLINVANAITLHLFVIISEIDHNPN